MSTVDTTTPDNAVAREAAARPRRPGLNTETIALGGLFIAIFAFLAATFAVALAARAVDDAKNAVGTGGGGAAAGSVEVDMMEFMFMPSEISVPAGTSTLHVVNSGSIDHALAIEGGNETGAVPAGEEADLDISGLAPGTYTVTCTIAGHVESGMSGTLTIA